jgi:hypothetical protein
MEYRATITVQRQRPISMREYSSVLAALERWHGELGPVGGGGGRDTATYVMSTDRWPTRTRAAQEMVEALFDALRYAGLDDAWPVDIELERVDADAESAEPQMAHG